MRRWRWWRRDGSTRSAGRSSGPTLGRADLIADFLNPGPSDFIEHSNDITVPRHAFSADRNFDSRIRFVQSVESRNDFLVLNILPVETDGVTRADGKATLIPFM